MKRSESIAKLAEAQAKAQGKIKNAVRAASNPGFKRGNEASKYADLAAVWDACREALSENGIAVFQTPAVSRESGPPVVTVTTLLAHTSGEWLESDLSSPSEAKPQAIGSTITYLRRYALAAMAGVAPEDDDGNAGSGVDADAGRPARQQEPQRDEPAKNEPAKSNRDRVAEKVAAANGKAAPVAVEAYKAEAFKEAAAILGDAHKAGAWLCGVREDPRASRPWTEADVEKVKAQLVTLKAKHKEAA